jgi:RecA/RadA recombinase
MNPDVAALVAEGIDIDKIMGAAVTAAEKKSKLQPVYLKRDSFAAYAIHTGSLWLDLIMGGGIPPSRIVGISGPEHSGKSLLATEIIANQLRAGRHAFYKDAEGGSDPLFLKSRGIDFDLFRGKRDKKGKLKDGERDLIHYYQPTTGDEVLHFIHELAAKLPENRTPTFPTALITLDSVVALVTDAVSDDIDSNRMAMHAKMYSEMLPIINSNLIRTGCSFIYTNQIRQKPMASKYENPDYEPCGSALRYFASIRLRLSASKPKFGDNDHPFADKDKGFIKDAAPKAGGVWEEPHYDSEGQEVGLDRYTYTAIRTVKNKVYNPFKVCWIRTQFEENGSTGRGLDKVFDVFSFLHQVGLIKPAVLTAEEKAAKVKVEAVKGRYEPVAGSPVDLVALGMPKRWTYQQFKKWINETPSIVMVLRDKLLVSGWAFNNLESTPDHEAERQSEQDETETAPVSPSPLPPLPPPILATPPPVMPSPPAPA